MKDKHSKYNYRARTLAALAKAHFRAVQTRLETECLNCYPDDEFPDPEEDTPDPLIELNEGETNGWVN